MRRGLRADAHRREASAVARGVRAADARRSSFTRAALALSAGGGVERRRLLDRVALYASPESLAEGVSYGQAMRARQRVLEKRGEARGRSR